MNPSITRGIKERKPIRVNEFDLRMYDRRSGVDRDGPEDEFASPYVGWGMIR